MNNEMDILYDEIEEAAVYIAATKIDNDDLNLVIIDFDINIDKRTAHVSMENEDIEVLLHYDHNTRMWSTQTFTK